MFKVCEGKLWCTWMCVFVWCQQVCWWVINVTCHPGERWTALKLRHGLKLTGFSITRPLQWVNSSSSVVHLWTERACSIWTSVLYVWQKEIGQFEAPFLSLAQMFHSRYQDQIQTIKNVLWPGLISLMNGFKPCFYNSEQVNKEHVCDNTDVLLHSISEIECFESCRLSCFR